MEGPRLLWVSTSRTMKAWVQRQIMGGEATSGVQPFVFGSHRVRMSDFPLSGVVPRTSFENSTP